MEKLLVAFVAVALTTLTAFTIAGGAAGADVYRVTATMDPQQVVTVANKPWRVPAVYAKAKGMLSGTFDEATGKLTWTITFSDLAHPKLRIVDIHYGTPGRFGAFLARVCAGCKSGQRGIAKIKPTARKDLAAGNAWVTLITEAYPNGVIRGQVKAWKSH
jgi:hypothetical protein